MHFTYEWQVTQGPEFFNHGPCGHGSDEQSGLKGCGRIEGKLRGTSETDHGQEKQAVNLYPEFTYQTFQGFGASITESVGYVYDTMCRETKQAFLRACFSGEGLAYTQARMPIDSCDASLSNYSAMEKEDPSFASFSIHRDERYALPLVEAAQEVLGEKLSVMMSPWSPPPFMKTNGEKNHGGTLRAEYRQMWAEYLCTYLQAYLDRGIAVSAVSMQNEPAAVQTWDSCVFSGEEEKEFLRDYLFPEMRRRGLDGIRIYIWDHNKERAVERAAQVIDETTAGFIRGIAFHWYSGTHFEALDLLRERYPDLALISSESCVEYSVYDPEDQTGNAVNYLHNIFGELNHGTEVFISWCALLDAQGGPNHVENYVEAPLMYERETDTLQVRPIWHFLKALTDTVRPGSVRIGMSRFSEEIDVTAWRQTDGSIRAAILNRCPKTRQIYLRLAGEVIPLSLEGRSIGTLRIKR